MFSAKRSRVSNVTVWKGVGVFIPQKPRVEELDRKIPSHQFDRLISQSTTTTGLPVLLPDGHDPCLGFEALGNGTSRRSISPALVIRRMPDSRRGGGAGLTL